MFSDSVCVVQLVYAEFAVTACVASGRGSQPPQDYEGTEASPVWDLLRRQTVRVAVAACQEVFRNMQYVI